MKHAIQRWLCLFLVLTLTVGLLPAGIVSGAPNAVALGAGQFLVDDDFAKASNKDVVTAEVGGVTYQGVMGTNAFASIADALAKTPANSEVYIAAGVYEGGFSISQNMSLYGNGMNVNPNNDDWTLNPKRSNLANETVLIGEIVITASKLSKMVFNGFTMTGATSLRETTSGGANKGIDVCYNRLVDLIKTPTYAADGGFYFINATSRTGTLRFNRVESKIAMKPVTFRYPLGFTFEGNYMSTVSSPCMWVTAEVANAVNTPSVMDVTFKDNYIVSTSTEALWLSTHTASSVDIVMENNYFKAATNALDLTGSLEATPDKRVTMIGNTFDGGTRDIYMNPKIPYNPSSMTIRENNFVHGTIINDFDSKDPLNLSYNYFGVDNKITSSPKPIIYPKYTNVGMTALKGVMNLDDVKLSGVLGDGSEENVPGVQVDNAAATVTLKNILDSGYRSLKVEAIVTAADSDIDVGYYSDIACTKELTDGNVIDYLKKGNNLAYIKLATSLDDYNSYRVYTISFERAPSHDAEILGIKDFVGTISDNEVNITIPSVQINPNVQLEVSGGAKYELFDSEHNSLGGTVISNLPVGETKLYALVTAEDGETTKEYVINLIRAPYTATEILEFKSPANIKYDDFEEAYLGVYPSVTDKASVDVVVSDRATWKLFEDADCTQEISADNMELEIGDNVVYIKVTSESAAKSTIYTLILRRETAEASKQINAVTSEALSSKVDGDTVSIKIAHTITDYVPTFDYIGSNIKLFASYENGVLGDAVPNNKLTSIAAGKYTYYIQVIAADGSSRVYTLEFEREASKESKLLAVDGGKGYIDRFDYIVTTTEKQEGAYTPVFTVSDGATVQVLDTEKNAVDFPLNLRPGANDYFIVVTAENGIDKIEYTWSITCLGDGVEILSGGVVLNTAWSECEPGDILYTSINGEAYKVYFGENAFADYTTASMMAPSKGGILYVVSGTSLNTSISVTGFKLYGANYAIDANTGNRYAESVINSKVTITGTGAAISGFTFTENAYILNNAAQSTQINNNIFKDEAQRTRVAIAMNLTNSSTGYSNVTIKGNRFELNSAEAAITLAKGGARIVVSNNYFVNDTDAAMMIVKAMVADASLEFSNNNVISGIGLMMEENSARRGYLYVHHNTFTGQRAVSLNAEKADESFAFNFNNNKVGTEKVSVYVTNAPATMADNFVANRNSFDDINISFNVEYDPSLQIGKLSPIDITANYFGTATPGNEYFDIGYAYRPYCINAEKTQLSNVVRAANISANDQAMIDDGFGKFIVVSGNVATVKAEFVTSKVVPAGAYGTIYMSDDGTNYVPTNELNVTFTKDTKVYVLVESLDQTAEEIHEVNVYSQTANPVYNVYDVIHSAVNGMDVTVVLGDKATSWTPNMAIVDDLPIALYSDAACTKKITGKVALKGDSTTVYGKVEGFDPVTITLFKKLSAEKAILSIQDAYTFEYTGSNTLNIKVDDRKTVADLSATVSKGANYVVYTDASCLTPVADPSKVAATVSKLYYKVTAADATVKVFEVSVEFVPVTDPAVLSVLKTQTISKDENTLVAQVKNYDSVVGFKVKLETPVGCTYKLYVDKEHTLVYKNDTAFFASNYVYVYAVVTSPDAVVTKEYTIKLQKPAASIKFVDAIPSWAKKAVNYTKDLGIVNGEKVKGGYKLNANGTTTREMMACFVVRMMGVDVTQYSSVDLSGFADAANVSNWALPSIKAAVALGFFTGSKEGDQLLLNPKNDITREQFAIVFVRAIGAEDTNVKAYSFKYSDAANIATWARTHVKIISKLGLMKGDNGKFNPKASITRAEIIQTIYNYMK